MDRRLSCRDVTERDCSFRLLAPAVTTPLSGSWESCVAVMEERKPSLLLRLLIVEFGDDDTGRVLDLTGGNRSS
jgi:hypothetical protein